MTTKLLAQISNPVLPEVIGGGKSPNYQAGGTALGAIVTALVGALFVAGFLLAFFFLIMGGFTWITAGGDKTKLEKARDEITNAIIGIIVVAAAYAITSLVARFFGLSLQALPIPSVISPTGTP
jgi:hypothetical protein